MATFTIAILYVSRTRNIPKSDHSERSLDFLLLLILIPYNFNDLLSFFELSWRWGLVWFFGPLAWANKLSNASHTCASPLVARLASQCQLPCTFGEKMATGPGCSERLESSTHETQEGHQHGALVQCRSKCIKLGNVLPSVEINTSSPVTPLIVCVVCSVAQSCLTLQDPLDCSSPGSPIHGIFQARTMEWVAISCSRGYSWLRDWTHISCIAGGFFTCWAIHCGIHFLST